MRSNKIGLYFEREVINSIKIHNIHVYKIPAIKYSTFGSAGLYDIGGVHNGKGFGFECKAMNIYKSFSFDLVQENQVSTLLDLHNSGGLAYILINIRDRKDHRLVYIRIDEFLRMKKEFATKSNWRNKKSIPVSYLKELPFIKRNSKGILWDLIPLLEERV